MENFDTETFVELVRDRPALWDVRSEEYADKIKKKECWLEIFRVMVKNFDNFSVETKERTSAKIQRKWKSLRNCFTRELTKQKSEKTGAGASNRKKYVYFDILTFLIPALTDKSTSSYLLTETDEDKASSVRDKDRDGETTMGKERDREKETAFPGLKRKRNETDDFLQDFSETPKRSSKRRTQHENLPEDDDKLFLISLHKDLKSIPAERKLMAKAELIQVLNRYNNFQTFFLSVHPVQHVFPSQFCEPQLSMPKSSQSNKQIVATRAVSTSESSDDSEGSILSILNDDSYHYRL
ncbi:uncharacterized protein LOC143152591 [Ptiloglossa arizonensis]|uniref:uncharacterized protein LOC143152591 n=1 Tax=Ptiloglossa arizonensis TaxID=3350558 RepID=UPI003FA11F7B